MIKQLNERTEYIVASDHPLSADIGLVFGDRRIYVFDVGKGDASYEELKSRLSEFPDKETVCILSHFHEDHTGNFKRFNFTNAYVGSQTHKYVKTGEIVTSPLVINDGITLTVFPLSSSHSKGSLGLAVNDEFAFLGDATYPCEVKGQAVYNRGLLQEELSTLKALPVKHFLLSHKTRFIYPAPVIIRELEAVYSKRKPNEAYINAER